MSESFYDEMEALIGKHRQQDADKARDEATEERFERIESGFNRMTKLIEERLPKDSPQQSNSEDSRGDKGEDESTASDKTPPPEPPEELEVERITKFNVPKIYTGDDEPEIVNYIDADTGEPKTRKGRRKNRPTGYSVERIEAETTIEPEGIPTEPDEANG
jgi:hypothetical protein